MDAKHTGMNKGKHGDLKSASVGEYYPLSISAKGNPHLHPYHDDALRWYVWHTGTGDVLSKVWLTARDADHHARKIYNTLYGDK